MMNKPSSPMTEGIRAIAEGKIGCVCGNQDWTKYLYVGMSVEEVVAGCKRCGGVLMYADGQWIMKKPPVSESQFN